MSKAATKQLTKNSKLNEQQIIKLASEIAAKTAIETLETERKKVQKSRHDRRLRNTKLLLRNYRMLLAHCTNAIYDKHQIVEENAIDILDSISDNLYDEELYVESIKRSAQRTSIIMQHTDEMLKLYEIYCTQSDDPIEIRRCRTIHSLYIAQQPKTVKEIAEDEHIDTRTVYKDVDAGSEKLSALLFGIDGLRRN